MKHEEVLKFIDKLAQQKGIDHILIMRESENEHMTASVKGELRDISYILYYTAMRNEGFKEALMHAAHVIAHEDMHDLITYHENKDKGEVN